jgi:hypothetical protein
MTLSVLQGPTIPAGQSMSNAVDCSGSRIARIILPDSWTAAPLSFLMSTDDITYRPVFHVQVATDTFVSYEVVMPVLAPGAVLLMPQNTGSGLFWVKFRSGTRTAPVVQAAARAFQVVLDTPTAAWAAAMPGS